MPATPNSRAASNLPAPLRSGSSEQTRWLAIAAVGIVAVTVFHYATDSHAVSFHNVYRRLYYIPIVLAAFSHGVRGGLGAALLSVVAYLPHAFFMDHADPSPAVDKVLEMVLYVAIGGLTGWLVNRQNEVRQALERSLVERDALEESLVRAGKLSALGQLTSGLAHEIRNPLASILGSAEALVSEFGPDHRKHRMGQLLLAEIDRLNGVVSDFLRFARPTEPQREAVDPAALAREVAELTAARARQAGVAIDLDAARPATVRADAGQVRQVILNFFLNAYEALEDAGAGAGRISVVTERRTVGEQGFWCLGVQDDGPGVPAELRDKIFDPYFTTRQEGTGLGLSVSSRIAEAHGGFVDVTSVDGRTTFWLCLPEV